MTPELNKKFNAIEDIRHRINFHFASWSDEQFNRKPAAGGWSQAQVISHLVQSESLSVKYVKKKLSYPDTLKKGPLAAWFRYSLLKIALRLPIRYKAPGMVSGSDEILSKNDLLKQWEDVRKEMAGLLDNFPEELLGTNVFKHLVAGRLKITQMLDFIFEHLTHHERQIFRDQ